MNSPRYPEAFKIETVKQVSDRGRPVSEIAKTLGVSCRDPLLGYGRSLKWLLRMAKAAPIAIGVRGWAAERAGQAILAGKWRRLRLP